MASPYLVEVRTGGESKNYLREIIFDVANTFDVWGAASPRPVPHITMFGPYNTRNGPEVKKRLLDVFKNYDVVPFKVEGFDRFRENNVIYAKVVPSPALRELRRDIFRALEPVTSDYQSHDTGYYYDFHITIAFRDVGRKFEDIWEYLNTNYDPQFEEYATRITNLRRRDMMWEYDPLQDRVMGSDEATSADSWERTMELLDQRAGADDHENLAEKPGPSRRWLKLIGAKARREW